GALLLPDRRSPPRSVEPVPPRARKNCPVREGAGCAGDAREAGLGAGIPEAAGRQEHLVSFRTATSRLPSHRCHSCSGHAIGSIRWARPGALSPCGLVVAAPSSTSVYLWSRH